MPPPALDRRSWLLAVVLVGAVVAAYAPVLHAGYIWDDDTYLVDNLALRSADGLRRIWLVPGATTQYYPLVFTTFWIEYHLWQAAPLGYHLVNVVLHAASAVMVWRLLRRLEVPGALLAAAIFGLHPVHVESVAWVTERKNVLSGLFYLLSLSAYLRFRPLSGAAASTERQRWVWWAAALVLFAAALTSKTVTASLPAVVLLLVWWKRGTLTWDDVVPLVPFFALGLGFGGMTAWVERTIVGARGPGFSLTVVERILVAGRAVWFYLGKLAWPTSLTFIYPRWTIDPLASWQYLFPAAAILGIGGLWLARERIGRGPLVAALFFVGTLVPALGFIDVFPMRYSFVADHFQYLASLGPIVLAAALVGRARPACGSLSIVAAVCVVPAVLGVLTWRQAHVYESVFTLWTDTLAKDPSSWMAHNNLGLYFRQQHRDDEALAHYEESIRLNPRNEEAHNNVGNILLDRGRLDDAIAAYRESIRLKPGYAGAHNDLGIAYSRQGRADEAIAEFRLAIRLRPDLAPPYLNLGVALAAQGQLDEAARAFAAAVARRPRFPKAQYQWGLVLLRQGRKPEAAEHLRKALELDPAFADARRALAEATAAP